MINKSIVTEKIRPCLDKIAALVKQELGDDYTLDVSATIRFDSEQAKIAVVFINTPSGEITDLKALALKKHYPLFYNKNLTYMGTAYKIVGYNQRATKTPFIVRNLTNNKNYRMSFAAVDMWRSNEE